MGLYAAFILISMLFLYPKNISKTEGRVVIGCQLGLIVSLICIPSILGGVLFGGLLLQMILIHRNQFSIENVWFGRSYLTFVKAAFLTPFRIWNKSAFWSIKQFKGADIYKFMSYLCTIVSIVILFFVLFSLSNPILFRFVKSSYLFVININSVRVVFWLFITMGLICLAARNVLAYRLASKWRVDFFSFTFQKWPVSIKLLLLSLVNIGLLFQNGLDAIYLWGTYQALPEGVTYAEYVHQGAYTLTFAAVLAGFLILLLFDYIEDRQPVLRSEPGSTVKRWVLNPKSFAIVYIVQNLFLTLSSAKRMMMYVDEYAFTLLRFGYFVWIGIILMGFTWILFKLIWNKSDVWFLRANIITVFIMLYIICFVPVRYYIAEYNVTHPVKRGTAHLDVDINYLRDLGEPAYPALTRYLSDKSRKLDPRIQIMEHPLYNWRTYTVQRHMLYRTIKTYDGT